MIQNSGDQARISIQLEFKLLKEKKNNVYY